MCASSLRRRKALLHWRHRKLTLSFRSLVTMVFRTRIEEAKRLKDSSDRRIQSMEAEMARATADRQRAEMAKRAARPSNGSVSARARAR